MRLDLGGHLPLQVLRLSLMALTVHAPHLVASIFTDEGVIAFAKRIVNSEDRLLEGHYLLAATLDSVCHGFLHDRSAFV